MHNENNIFLSENSYENKRITYSYEYLKINGRTVIPNCIAVSLAAADRDRFWNAFKYEDKKIKP